MSESSKMLSIEQLSHDILNFVAAAKLSAEVASRAKELPEAVRKHLARIQQNLIHIQDLLEQKEAAVETCAQALESAVEPQVPEQTLLKVADASATKEAAERGPRSVLVVDDSADIRMLFGLLLKPKGFQVTTAKNGAEALLILSQNPPPQVILLDYMLGDLNGSELLDKLEEADSDVFRQSKIVMLSGHGNSIKDSRVSSVRQKAMDAKALVALVESLFDVN